MTKIQLNQKFVSLQPTTDEIILFISAPCTYEKKRL